MELSKSEESMKLRLQLAQSKSYLDMKDLMLLTGYSYSTLKRRIESGSLKAIQEIKGGKLLFSKEQIELWLKQGAR